MDQVSQERIAQIISAGSDSITDADAEFLRARRAYLSEEQLATFADALKTENVSAAETTDEAPSEKPVKAKPAK